MAPETLAAAVHKTGVYWDFRLSAFLVDDPIVTDDFGNRLDIAIDPGIALSGTGGFDFGRVRTEAEWSVVFARPDRDTSSLTAFTFDGRLYGDFFLANAWLDFENRSGFTPYVGGGLGHGRIYVSQLGTGIGANYIEDADGALAYQVGAGFRHDVSRRVSLGMDVVRLRTRTFRFDSAEMDFESTLVSFGVRYRTGVGARPRRPARP